MYLIEGVEYVNIFLTFEHPQVSPPMGAGGAPTNMVGLNAGGMTPGSVQVNMVGGAAQVGQTMVMGMPSSQV